MGFGQLLPMAWHRLAELGSPCSQEGQMLGAELGLEGTELELLPGQEPGETQVGERRGVCPLVTTPGLLRHTCCSASVRHAAAGTTCACPDSAVVELSEENPIAVQQVAQRQQCPVVPARLVPGPLQLLSPNDHPTSCTPSLLVLLGWVRMLCPSTGLSGNSGRDSMTWEPLALPCSSWMFADQVAP